MEKTKKTMYDKKESIDGIMKGIEHSANLIGATLGPKGKNIVVRDGKKVMVINDGVSIAKLLVLDNDLENIGAQMVKEIALKTNLLAGDGTTTATVLAHAILKNAFLQIELLDHLNVVKIKDYLIEISKEVARNLKKTKQIIEDKGNNDVYNKIVDIASISCNGDLELSKIIADAFKAVNYKGFIMVKDGRSVEDEFDVFNGFKYDSGWLHLALTNNKHKKGSIMEDPYVFVTDQEISHPEKIVLILEAIAETGKPLVIFAKDINGPALATLLENRIGGFDITAVRLPGPEFEKNLYAKDIATYTDAILVDESVDFNSIELKHFGTVDSSEVYPDHFIIKKENLNEKRIENAVLEIEAEMNQTKENTYFSELHSIRLSKLRDGYVVIYAGGYSDIEITEKKLRIEDAINSVTAALKNGYLPGGGTALFYEGLKMRELLEIETTSLKDEEFHYARSIMSMALMSPLVRIISNCGYKDNEIKEKMNYLIDLKDKEIGFDAKNSVFVNMCEKGIIDPYDVTVSALLNATSIASVVTTIGGTLSLESQN